MKRITSVLGFCAVMISIVSANVEVELVVEEPIGVKRTKEWVAIGVPLAKGLIKDILKLQIVSEKEVLPCQFKKQSSWQDGSIKWVLCIFPVSIEANGKLKFILTDSSDKPLPQSVLKLTEDLKEIIVDTGPLNIKINKNNFNIFEEVSLQGKTLLKQDKENGIILLKTLVDKFNAFSNLPEKVNVEENGPYRGCVMARGRFKGAYMLDGDDMIRWTCRVYFFNGSNEIRVFFTLGNDGAYGSNSVREKFEFKELRLDFSTLLGTDVKALSAETTGSIPVEKESFKIYQKGAYPKKGNIFESSIGGKNLVSNKERSKGAFGLTGKEAGIGVAIEDFWQNYPKIIEGSASKLSLILWPREDGYPEKSNNYTLWGGKQKTYQIRFIFGDNITKEEITSLADIQNYPLIPLASPDYYADCGALGLFSPAGVITDNSAVDSVIKRYDNLQKRKPSGITEVAEREGKRGTYYNWMNYGDLYWACGSCSLHYDWTHCMLIHFLRIQHRDFFDWGKAMARHQYDIDIHRSPRDLMPYRYLSAYEKETKDSGQTGTHISNSPESMQPITSHNWIEGQCLYASLTGDMMSWSACRINAEGVRNRLFNTHGLDKKKANVEDMEARACGHGMDCLLSLYSYTGENSYLEDAKKIFENGLYYIFETFGKTGDVGGFVQTRYVVKPLINYHWYTGDERAIEMLKKIVEVTWKNWKGEAEWIMVSDGAAYVYYRTGDESYLKKARECVKVELQGRGGTFNNNNGAWTKEEAKNSRSGYIWIAIERLKKMGKAPVK
ncbi:MAG: hypothetical protein ABH873_01315 [Candidatus Firestonebacteria bacterium]